MHVAGVLYVSLLSMHLVLARPRADVNEQSRTMNAQNSGERGAQTPEELINTSRSVEGVHQAQAQSITPPPLVRPLEGLSGRNTQRGHNQDRAPSGGTTTGTVQQNNQDGLKVIPDIPDINHSEAPSQGTETGQTNTDAPRQLFTDASDCPSGMAVMPIEGDNCISLAGLMKWSFSQFFSENIMANRMGIYCQLQLKKYCAPKPCKKPFFARVEETCASFAQRAGTTIKALIAVNAGLGNYCKLEPDVCYCDPEGESAQVDQVSAMDMYERDGSEQANVDTNDPNSQASQPNNHRMTEGNNQGSGNPADRQTVQGVAQASNDNRSRPGHGNVVGTGSQNKRPDLDGGEIMALRNVGSNALVNA